MFDLIEVAEVNHFIEYDESFHKTFYITIRLNNKTQSFVMGDLCEGDYQPIPEYKIIRNICLIGDFQCDYTKEKLEEFCLLNDICLSWYEDYSEWSEYLIYNDPEHMYYYQEHIAESYGYE